MVYLALSLSARRAWIEIFKLFKRRFVGQVALRKESVDRNTLAENPMISVNESLSARRAWIEICGGAFGRLWALSSLSARRAWIEIIFPPPQVKPGRGSLSARRAWIEITAHTAKKTSIAGRSPQGERG